MAEVVFHLQIALTLKLAQLTRRHKTAVSRGWEYFGTASCYCRSWHFLPEWLQSAGRTADAVLIVGGRECPSAGGHLVDGLSLLDPVDVVDGRVLDEDAANIVATGGVTLARSKVTGRLKPHRAWIAKKTKTMNSTTCCMMVLNAQEPTGRYYVLDNLPTQAPMIE